MKYVIPAGLRIPERSRVVRDAKSNPFARVEIVNGDVVADVGAFVGTFAIAAILEGAARAICFEPDPSNADMLRQNVANGGYPIIVRQQAVSARAGLLELHDSPRGQPECGSLRKKRGSRLSVQVEAVTLEDVAALGPTVLKIDIEGAEYVIMPSATHLDGVREVVVEFHEAAKHIDEIVGIATWMSLNGFSLVGNLWFGSQIAMQGVWRRKSTL